MRKLATKYGKWLERDIKQIDLVTVHQAVMQLMFEVYREEFVNEWMGAACVGLLDQTGTSVSLKLNDNRDISILEYVDVL
jgi:hypothetical protein